jgi:hypothetical protein
MTDSSEILEIFCNYLALLEVEDDICLSVKRSTMIMNVNNILSKILSTFLRTMQIIYRT